MGAFSIAALGMAGVPPVAGFVSKWYLGAGALEAGEGWVVVVLVLSGLLNAAYFLPILKTAWVDAPATPWPDRPAGTRLETSWMLLLPTLVTALLSLLVGLLAGAPFSPLAWAQRIAVTVFAP
jgi:multicomponent Na+:H+ antiporter subunit D